MTRHSSIKKRIIYPLALLSAVAIGTSHAKPAGLDNISDAEMRLLPRYCPDTQGFKYGYKESPNSRHWEGMMGATFWHLHHYCWSLIQMNRSNRAGISRNKQLSLQEAALGGYLYVINNAPDDFILLPEIYTRKGEVELLLTKISNADQSFAKARQLKPDYWPAYSHWADYLITSGKRSDALAIVRSGLAHSPGAKVLLEQYRLLGGKPSDILKPAKTSEPNEEQD